MTFYPTLKLVGVALAAIFLSAGAQAQIVFTVTDTRPGELDVTQPSSTLGSVASTAAVPTATYSITGLDLTSVGGGASETIAFDIDYTQTGGTGVQINSFGNISVTGGANDNQIDVSPVDDEDLTATLSLNAGLTTFTGDLSLSLIEVTIGGYNAWEQYNLTTEAGTSTIATGDPQTIDSSFLTIDPIDIGGYSNTDQINLSGFTVEITAGTNSGPSGFASWQTANSTAGGIDEDHDGDEVENAVEFFLGGPNDTTGFTPLPGVIDTGGTLSVTWTKASDYPGTYGTDFWVESSTTLAPGSWSPETLGANVTITGDDVKYTFPAGAKNFARLVVNGPL